jgi:hypothetical protein
MKRFAFRRTALATGAKDAGAIQEHTSGRVTERRGTVGKLGGRNVVTVSRGPTMVNVL